MNTPHELWRGAAETIHADVLLKKIKAGKKLRIKHGIDPTAADLHLGYAVNYTVLRRFKDAGHTVIFMIGDFTTRIGDPTDRDKTRPVLTKEQIEKNVKSILKQVGKILDLKKLEVRYNSEWWGKMKLEEFLQIARNITAVKLWERDMFQNRLKNGGTVYTHEFLYPLLQGYDSVMLKSDATVIGRDQIFNELMGRELQQIYKQEPQALIAMPLLVGTDGKRKMSQSMGNYIGIAESPDQQFGKVMSMPDENIESFARLLTDIDEKHIAAMASKMKKGELNPRDAKLRVAELIVTRFNDAKKATAAREQFLQTFQKKELPTDIEEFTTKQKSWKVIDLFAAAALVSSKSEGRRLIEQKGLLLAGERVSDPQAEIVLSKKGVILQRGPRRFVKARLK